MDQGVAAVVKGPRSADVIRPRALEPARTVPNPQRLACLRGENTRNRPPRQQQLLGAAARREPFKRQLVGKVAVEAVVDVERRGTAVGRDVVEVLRRGRQQKIRIVGVRQAPRPGVVESQAEAFGEALLDRRLPGIERGRLRSAVAITLSHLFSCQKLSDQIN